MPCNVGKNSNWRRSGGVEWWRNNPLPNSAGVYAIYLNRKLVYIGSSANLRRRLNQHNIVPSSPGYVRTNWGRLKVSLVHFKWKVTRRYGEHLMLEVRLIRRIRPQFNRQFGLR